MASALTVPEMSQGLGAEDTSSAWPRVSPQVKTRPIDLLAPNSDAHRRVLNYLVDRIQASERHMRNFYSRWRVNELKYQAYVNLPDWENQLRHINNANAPPIPTRIIVPYTFATISTITTFLLHVFAGQRPMFAVQSWKDETVQAAMMMEMKLQYDADHSRLIRQMNQFFQDTQVYGLGVLRPMFVKETAMRTRQVPGTVMSLEGVPFTRNMSVRSQQTVYEGNQVYSQDPFLFFPDPRVPMIECARRGEFAFWRNFEGKHMLLRQEADGKYKWVKYASVTPPRNEGILESARGVLSRGVPHAGASIYGVGSTEGNLRDNIQVDQGTIEIIPRELGLGDSDAPEKWLFTILNKSQIVQAEPFDADHGMHPIAVSEPYTLGYGFGQPGMADYLGPISDLISWFFNSHMDNVRKSLNDMFVVDPSMIEMQDMKTPEPGKLIRLKRTAWGQDVRMAVAQLAVQDVTKQHIDDAWQIIELGQLLSGVSYNRLGMQEQGGRKTATEVRSSSEGSASRLAAMARIISAQGIADLSTMMCLNNQQYLSDDFYIQIMGREGLENPIRITPDQLAGDFYFPVHDGTLPSDRVALLDVWKEIFLAVQSDPTGQLRMTYSLPRIFEFLAELGGAKNIESFRLGAVPDDRMAMMAQMGNVIPLNQAQQMIPPGGQAPGRRNGSGRTNALPSQSSIPAARAVQALG
jgi:hypothetical protein